MFGSHCLFLLLPLYALGHKLTYQKLGARISWSKVTVFSLFSILWLNLALGYANLYKPEAKLFDAMLGGLGLKMRVVFDRWLGWGSLILLATSLSIFLVYYGNLCLSHR